ncbi:ABC transporter ATP-binding protein [Rehaibacterium terrae]|uniref:ABC-type polysaccharide/polyol phosphate transport system ATPase subunit n=1 Tax=Rehaibacterium terrae TaxID=1341696 RepID=A0A7W7XY19_9GAMM|nr:ABC transporter ATP-binding protein [Rehaibacterium terrae]MBB5014454.1 ABC-type polysaccharide/polyol phosphate transport system ATPase subunit [Rehaibacterium terrae]
MPLFTQDARGVRATLGLFLRAAFQPPRREVCTTLDGISFSLQAGDRLAVVGRNGAGKSTLLKVLVGAYPPTRGHVEICGSRQALLNLSLGFNQEATVVENIMLRGIAMGLRSQQASAVIDEVLDFAELTEKAGHRLRTLSAGQRMRLGFALATAVQHEILIMDEWIGTGDAGFVAKARDRIRSRVNNARIVVLASHNFQLIKDVCNVAMLLEAGRSLAYGPVEVVLRQYETLLREAASGADSDGRGQ